MNKQVTEWKGLPIKTAPVRAYGQRPPVDRERATDAAFVVFMRQPAGTPIRSALSHAFSAYEANLKAQEAEWIWDDDLDCWVKREA